MSHSNFLTKVATGSRAEVPLTAPATLADLLLTYLEMLGVEYIFGVPGGAIEPLYNALARGGRMGRGKPSAIIARHEAGAAFMADGYSRATGKIGVCCATTGPGATNLITGVASAYENHIPLLVITAQTASKGFGHGAFQESSDTGINIVGMMQYCTAYNSLVSHPEQFEYKLITALAIAYAQKRPIHLSIPSDIFNCAPALPARANLKSVLNPHYSCDVQAAKNLAAALSASHKCVFIIGRDCGEAMPTVLAVAERMGAALVTTPDAKSLVDPYHRSYRGVIGFAGHNSAEEAVRDTAVDTILILGASLSEWCGGPLIGKLPQEKLLLVQESSIYLSRYPNARMHVLGNIKAVIEIVQTSLDPIRYVNEHDADEAVKLSFKPCTYTHDDGWTKALVKPQWLMSQLPISFPLETQFLADTGNSTAWAVHYLHANPRRTEYNSGLTHNSLQVTIEFAAMGWAIGASVGMALAHIGQPVVCITGDGSCLMNGQEITVAQEYRLPVVFIILNDGYLGMVKHGQRLAGAESIGTRLPAVDFARLAAAMGIEGHTISCPEDWYRLNLKKTWKRSAPVVLNVLVDPDDVPPIGVRIQTLTADQEKNSGDQ